MAPNKIKFTVWLAPDVLEAAKAQAALEGTSASKLLAAIARAALLDLQKQRDDKTLAAVERVFASQQRSDRRRMYDLQVLKEMIGLLVQSFFNHTPAVPDQEKRAALVSGKVRFNRFLDALAANLRRGESILNELFEQETTTPDRLQGNSDISEDAYTPQKETDQRSSHVDEKSSLPAGPRPSPQPPKERVSQAPRQDKPRQAENRSRWSLFG